MQIDREWRQGWLVVLAASLGMMVIATNPYTFGTFIGPLQNDFGWSRAEIALAMSFSGLLMPFTAPFIGAFADRVGARKIALTGVPIVCAALALLSQINGSIYSFWACFFLVAVGAVLCAPLIWTRPIIGQFSRNRGFALSLAVGGATVAGIIAPLISTYLITHFGWRMAYLGLAVILLVGVYPLIFLFFREAPAGGAAEPSMAEQVAQPEGAAPAHGAIGEPATSLTPAQILRMPAFWLIALSALFGGAAGMSIHAHLVPLLGDLGLVPMTAAMGMSLISVVSIAGRLGGGIMLDRMPTMTVVVVMLTPPILTCLFLASGPSNPYLILGTVAFLGLAVGIEMELLAFVSSRTFGYRSYGTAYGMVFAGFSVGGSIGPPLFGLLYGINGNYNLALLLMAAGFFLSAATLWFVKPPQVPMTLARAA